MAGITVNSTADVQSNPFASVREFYANEYKDKEFTYNELSAAVVVNIVNHLPRHGGIESSRWAPENSQDTFPTSGSIQKISSKNASPKKGFHKKGSSKNASPKKGFHNKGSSKNATYKNGFPNNGSFQKASYKNGFPKNGSSKTSDPRNDSTKGKMSLVSPPLNLKAEVIAPEIYKSPGTSPIAEKFIPSQRQKSPVVSGGLATSIYAVEALGLGTARVPFPAVVRSPDWTKNAKSAGSHPETFKQVSPIKQNSNILPHIRPTLEDAITPKYIPPAFADDSANISKCPQGYATSQKADKSLIPDTQGGLSVGVARGSDPHLYMPLHRQQNSRVTKYGETTITATSTSLRAYAKSVTSNSQSQKSEVLARQASSFKSSSPSSGASAWKNHRAIIEQSDRALYEERSETAAKGVGECLKLSFKDKWVPAVVEDGHRILKKAITLTVGGLKSHAASSGAHESKTPKPQEVPGGSSKPASFTTFSKINESASLNGYIMCDWEEVTDEGSHAMAGESAEDGGVKMPEFNTAKKVDAVIIHGPAVVKGCRTKAATFERSEIPNGNAFELATRNQFQNQDKQTSNPGTNTIDAFPVSKCVMSDWSERIEDFTDKKPELPTGYKPQVDSSNHVTQQDVQTLDMAVSHITEKISNCLSSSVISNGEMFPRAKTEATMDVKAEVNTPTKIEATSCQVHEDRPNTSSAIMNVIALLPALQGGKLATSWEEFTYGKGKPAIFKSYRVQKHHCPTLDFTKDTSQMLKHREFTVRNPKVIADEGDHQQGSQGAPSVCHTFDTILAEQFTNLKSKTSTITKDQQKTSEVSGSAMPVDTAVPPTESGWLASTWEEFNRGEGKPEILKSYRLPKQPSSTSVSSNIVANAFGARVHESLKYRTQVQDHRVAKRQRSKNYPNAGTLTGRESISAGAIGVHPDKQPVRGSKQPSSQEANVYPSTVLRNTNNVIKQRNELGSPAQVHAALVKEITDPKRGNGTIPLTRTNLMERTGVAPLETDSWGIDKAVSDDGVEVKGVEAQNYDIDKQHPGDIRNVLAREQRGMDLWGGDRAEVDLSYMPAYISSWASNIPMVQKSVDTNCDEFKTGLSPLCQLEFEKPIAQPLCYPDVARSENIDKARIQTAEIDCKQYLREIIKKQRRKDRAYTAQVAQNSTQFHHTPRVDPNAPTISCYLRPAEEKDVPGITAIYNHYISDSFIPEDQKRITEEQMHTVWAIARKESLPFIVAIQGPPPDHNNAYNETVLGFARADIYYGLGGGGMGRSRYLGVVEFYTHHQYLRKGIGRSLLDRILCTTSTSYLQKGGYDWAIPNACDSAVYNHFSGGGSPRRWHQLLIHRPIEVKNDPDYEWLKDWLQNKFYFFEIARLKSIARTKPVGAPARWLDMVTFQLEASTPGEFEAFQ